MSSEADEGNVADRLPDDNAPVPAEELQPEPPRDSRGVLWIIVPTLAGAAAGAVVGAVRMAGALMAQQRGEDWTMLAGVLGGGITGAALGGAVGVFIWVVFPYKRMPAESSPPAEIPPHPGRSPEDQPG